MADEEPAEEEGTTGQERETAGEDVGGDDEGEEDEEAMPRPVGDSSESDDAAPREGDPGDMPVDEGTSGAASASTTARQSRPSAATETTRGEAEPSRAEGGEAKESEEGEKESGYEPAGPTAVVGGLGFQYGLTDDSVGGFRLGFSYGYRLTDWMWFDAQANFSFGSDCKGEGDPKEYACGSVHGFGIEAIAGVQWKFYGIEAWDAPVIPFVRAGLGAAAIISNGPNDGVALIARGSGGVRFHFFPWFAVGGEIGASIGPAFRNDLDTGLFAAIDCMAGAEFHF
jgi:hypothetical protein